MNLNATLLGQMITFAIFVWFTMKYVWPPITKALDDRQKKIAEGLSAAERGTRELELAQHRAGEYLKEAKAQAAEIIEQANKRVNLIMEEAKLQSREEGQRLILLAKNEIAREVESAKALLKQQVASFAIQGAEKILKKNIDVSANQELIQQLIEQI
ncbi:MAG: ATP synthase subunit b [Legionellaceae bacterium]